MNLLSIFVTIVLLGACGRSAPTLEEGGAGDDGGVLRVAGTAGTSPDSKTSPEIILVELGKEVVFTFENRGKAQIKNLSETSETTDVSRTNCKSSLAPGERCVAAFVPSAKARVNGAPMFPGTIEVSYEVNGKKKRWRLDVNIVLNGEVLAPPTAPRTPPSSGYGYPSLPTAPAWPWFPPYSGYPTNPTPTPSFQAPQIKFAELSAPETAILTKKVAVGQWYRVLAWNAGPGVASVPRTRLDYGVQATADCNPDAWAVGYRCVVSYRLNLNTYGYAYITYQDENGVVREARLKLTAP